MRTKPLPYKELVSYQVKRDKLIRGFDIVGLTQRELVARANEELQAYGKYDEPNVSRMLSGKVAITKKSSQVIDLGLRMIEERRQIKAAIQNAEK